MPNQYKTREKKVLQSLLLLTSIIIVTLSLIGDKGILQLWSLRGEEAKLVEEIRQLKMDKELWISRVNSLKTNKTYLESIAREELGMIKADEILIEFE